MNLEVIYAERCLLMRTDCRSQNYLTSAFWILFLKYFSCTLNSLFTLLSEMCYIGMKKNPLGLVSADKLRSSLLCMNSSNHQVCTWTFGSTLLSWDSFRALQQVSLLYHRPPTQKGPQKIAAFALHSCFSYFVYGLLKFKSIQTCTLAFVNDSHSLLPDCMFGPCSSQLLLFSFETPEQWFSSLKSTCRVFSYCINDRPSGTRLTSAFFKFAKHLPLSSLQEIASLVFLYFKCV